MSYQLYFQNQFQISVDGSVINPTINSIATASNNGSTAMVYALGSNESLYFFKYNINDAGSTAIYYASSISANGFSEQMIQSQTSQYTLYLLNSTDGAIAQLTISPSTFLPGSLVQIFSAGQSLYTFAYNSVDDYFILSNYSNLYYGVQGGTGATMLNNNTGYPLYELGGMVFYGNILYFFAENGICQATVNIENLSFTSIGYYPFNSTNPPIFSNNFAPYLASTVESLGTPDIIFLNNTYTSNQYEIYDLTNPGITGGFTISYPLTNQAGVTGYYFGLGASTQIQTVFLSSYSSNNELSIGAFSIYYNEPYSSDATIADNSSETLTLGSPHKIHTYQNEKPLIKDLRRRHIFPNPRQHRRSR